MIAWSRPAILALVATSCASTDEATTPVVAVTFNTGTTTGLAHDQLPDDGYGPDEAAISDEHYGDGLAWRAAIDDARVFLAEVSPDVIGFQEIFDPSGCGDVPLDARAGFICETWVPGDPSVAQIILGEGYQVACHPGHADKCVAVKRAFGTFRGCTEDACADAMTGVAVAGCGSGARVARVAIDLAEGGELTLVNVHGTSGFSAEDTACRVAQVEQVFVDLGDGAPGANGARNLILGDLNTDPGRFSGVDASATRWNDFVGEGAPFRFVTEIGDDAPGSYAGAADIDHVIADSATGTCWIAGITPGRADVAERVYFDHHPVTCDLALRP